MSDRLNENEVWQAAVCRMLMEGYGVEDIAKELNSDVEAVRKEVRILREEGRLMGMFY